MPPRRARGLLAVLAGVGAACATPSGAPSDSPPPSGGGNATLERTVDAFVVRQPDGSAYTQPFLGGFNIPRPQLLDIDGDGDDDLFVQEASGAVMFFERVDDPAVPYAWRTDAFHDLEIGEWYRFVDLDRDGDADLLAEELFSYVRYYRNDGTQQQPRFFLAADSLKDTSGVPLFSDRQNIPNATDIDCDGQIDLLVGRLEGTVTRYEETGTDENGVPRFRHLTDSFEDIEIVAQIGGSLHGANTMALGDVDGDGDEDMFWGDYFEPGVLFLENRGTCNSPNLRAEPESFPFDDPIRTSGYNATTVGDPDGDGDLDVLVGVIGGAFNPNTTTVDNFHLIEQTAPGAFSDQTSTFLNTVDVGSESVPIVVDLDGDGDLDILLGNKIEQDDTQNGALYRFINVGSASAPEYRLDGELDVGSGYHFVPAFGDLDADGDLDAVLGTWQDQLRYLRNDATDGSIGLVPADTAFVTLTRGRNATPALGDIDADGDLDLFIGESSGWVNFYENTGSATRPEFTLVTDEYVNVGRRSFPVVHDYDGDGDLDLIVGTETDGVQLVRNVGSRTEADFVEAGPLPFPDMGYAAPAFADLDADGDTDLLLGGSRGGMWLYLNPGR